MVASWRYAGFAADVYRWLVLVVAAVSRMDHDPSGPARYVRRRGSCSGRGEVPPTHLPAREPWSPVVPDGVRSRNVATRSSRSAAFARASAGSRSVLGLRAGCSRFGSPTSWWPTARTGLNCWRPAWSGTVARRRPGGVVHGRRGDFRPCSTRTAGSVPMVGCPDHVRLGGLEEYLGDGVVEQTVAAAAPARRGLSASG